MPAHLTAPRPLATWSEHGYWHGIGGHYVDVQVQWAYALGIDMRLRVRVTGVAVHANGVGWLRQVIVRAQDRNGKQVDAKTIPVSGDVASMSSTDFRLVPVPLGGMPTATVAVTTSAGLFTRPILVGVGPS